MIQFKKKNDLWRCKAATGAVPPPCVRGGIQSLGPSGPFLGQRCPVQEGQHLNWKGVIILAGSFASATWEIYTRVAGWWKPDERTDGQSLLGVPKRISSTSSLIVKFKEGTYWNLYK